MVPPPDARPRRHRGEAGSDPPVTERGFVNLDGQLIPYSLTRSARRTRTVQLSVETAGLTVRAPMRTSLPFIEALIIRRGAWIVHQLAALRPLLQFETGETLPYLGRDVSLLLTRTRVRGSAVRYQNRTLCVRIPATVSDERRATTTRSALTRWYRLKTAALVRRALARWAPVVGVSPTAWTVREQKRRWGSCSASGVLRFNWRLSMFHPRVVDYVVVHELCHLRHPNHSRAFWMAVEDVLPGAGRQRAELRNASLPI